MIRAFVQQMIRWAGLSGDYRDLLWQPSLTAHDPNPPITLEDAALATLNSDGAASLQLVPGGSSSASVAASSSAPLSLVHGGASASAAIAGTESSPIGFLESGGSELVVHSSEARGSADIAGAGASQLSLVSGGDSSHGPVDSVPDSRPGGATRNVRRQAGTHHGFVSVPGIEISPLVLPRRSQSYTLLDFATRARSTVSVRGDALGVLEFRTSGHTELGPVPDDELAIALLMAVA